MKRLLLVAIAILAVWNVGFTQSYHLSDINTARRYLEENVSTLDPIEGIYSVSLQRLIEELEENQYKTYNRTKSDSRNFKCAIVRSNEGIEFQLFFDKPMSDNGYYKRPKVMKFSRIGETPLYNCTMIYPAEFKDDPDVTVSCRVSMESLFNFHASIKTTIKYWGVQNMHYDTYHDEYDFIKEYPTVSMYEQKVAEESKPSAWTGTGWAIGSGYLVTNYHVVEDAGSISIKGVKGNFSIGYSAQVVATDRVNDIAVLKINDSQFKGYGTVPYGISSRMADVGEDIFVLGYPLTQTMGEEIKLTNGIISSRTGFQGDVANYQMSAPIQPGNSGGPMFDSKGNVIGIVCAHHKGAENASYAIKTSYLKILIESAGLNIPFPGNNTISTLPLAEKVKRAKNFVFYIECSK